MDDISISPSDLVALLNQTLDFAYPSVTVVGELANFRVSRNKWVYFDLKDDESTVKFFGTVYALSGPLEDGLQLSVRACPHIHNLYGFSMQVASIQPVGEGSIKKAANLLAAKLEAEGLFDQKRKRPIPYPPESIGLVTSVQSAAYADFIKVTNARSGGLVLQVYDAQVQGEQAIQDVVRGIQYFNEQPQMVDVIVLTRGGGSAEDLAVFNNEQVVRAVAASRITTLVAIGHEVDVCLAELAADARASTPSNAAELLVPDRREALASLSHKQELLTNYLYQQLAGFKYWLEGRSSDIDDKISRALDFQKKQLENQSKLIEILNPHAVLAHGYALVRLKGSIVQSVATVKSDDIIQIQLSDGNVQARVT